MHILHTGDVKQLIKEILLNSTTDSTINYNESHLPPSSINFPILSFSHHSWLSCNLNKIANSVVSNNSNVEIFSLES